MRTILVVAPEPAAWLAPLVARAAELAQVAADQVVVLAPWATSGALAMVSAWGFGRIGRALERRTLQLPARVETQPGFLAFEAALLAWAGRDTARRLRARFLLRRAVGRLAAHLVSDGRDDRARDQLVAVIAPSGAAERPFAQARSRGVARVLVEDLPGLRRLHADLDAAVRAHPDARFLSRYRAPARVVARNEAERVLATRILVRSDYARDALIDAGLAPGQLAALPEAALAPPDGAHASARPARPAHEGRCMTILLAGPATARGGSYEALRVLDALPSLTLLVRAGEGLEPAALLAHPRVRRASARELTTLDGVDAVIAPAWCESHPPEVALARARGLPAITTRPAAGFASEDPHAQLVPGDVPSLVAATARAVAARGDEDLLAITR